MIKNLKDPVHKAGLNAAERFLKDMKRLQYTRGDAIELIDAVDWKNETGKLPKKEEE